ncbi:MMPL family transporter [Promicromonospora sp. MEB111]|uniref:MMPL family transporter n=1 Tax=Promicromonospora sp. MEB111 TaxID=3040301 RepID=UPI00255071D6|nr:MMPL family transporter [Promicromonospora sp. MEB111]
MIGRTVTRFPRLVIVLAALVLAACALVAAGTVQSLSLNRYEAPGSESLRAREQLGQRFGTSSPNVAILVTADAGVDHPTIATAGRALTEALRAADGVEDAWSYWSPSAPDTLRSEDGRHALVLAWVPGDADRVRVEVLPSLEALLAEHADQRWTLRLGGGDEVFRTVAEQARTDFLRAELIVLPLVGLLLWAVYRRWAAAAATLATGLFAVAGSLALIRVVTTFTEVSTFAANIALVMGIGLGVDYGLFVVHRFREEAHVHAERADAVRATVRAAGRTVVFSGATVAASLAVLLVFPFPFLSSFAYAGIAVVIAAVAAATLVLPALLQLAGDHMLLPRTDRPLERTFWYRVPAAVMRRPLAAGAVGLAILLALGAPAASIVYGSPDDRVLAGDHTVRTMYDTIRADFRTEDADALQVVTTGPADDLASYAAALSLIDGIERVDAASGSFVHGERVEAAGPFGPQRFETQEGQRLAVVPTGERLATDPVGLVHDVRALPAPVEVLVGGYPAELTDYRDGVVDRLPLVAGLLVAVTFVVLFLMTGSVIAPIKAGFLNLLSLTVMFGVVVWGFQDGALADLLGFTPTGSVEPSILLLMFCIAYGLSMDYEVFLLARIKEDFDRTGDILGSVPRGIARSAPLVTAAAVVLAASFAVYATSEVAFLQQLGIGMALAVLVDATIIRGVLVPALMRLAGRGNWWAPPALRRLHTAIGLTEEVTGELRR